MAENDDNTATKQAIRTAIKKIAKTDNIDLVEIINCNVVSVDKAARTCVVKPLSGKSDTEIEDVGLMVERNDGELKVPSVDSTVTVAMSTLIDPYLIGWSDLDEWTVTINKTVINLKDGSIQFGDGTYGGLTKTQDLETEIDKLNAQLQAVISTLTNWVPVPSDGGAALKTAFALAIALKPAGDFSDIENGEITHGPQL